MTSLNKNSSREERNTYLDKATLTRESGDLQTAITKLKEVVDWDRSNNHYRGAANSLGHLRICYSNLASNKEGPDKEELLKLAEECVEDALEMCDRCGEECRHLKQITYVHLASCRHDRENYLGALEAYDLALADFPGTLAHKSWPLYNKARTLIEKGNLPEAWPVIEEAERCYHSGYQEEVERDDQAEAKLNNWMTGILLCKSLLFFKEGMPIPARMYAQAVLEVEDPDDVLNFRREQASKILSMISEKIQSK